MSAPIDTAARVAGVVVGIALAAAAVASWRVAGGTGALGADVRLLASPTGEIQVSTTGPFLSATNLRPGRDAARGELGVRNQTGAALGVRVRVLPSLPDLDQLLVVTLDVGDDRLFEGTLGLLRAWSDRSFRLASDERRVLRVQAWLPPAATRGYEGRVADVGVEFRSEVIRR